MIPSAREARRAKFHFKLYSGYAWGIPILVVSGGHLSGYLDPLKDYSPDYATNYCWINSKAQLLRNVKEITRKYPLHGYILAVAKSNKAEHAVQSYAAGKG